MTDEERLGAPRGQDLAGSYAGYGRTGQGPWYAEPHTHACHARAGGGVTWQVHRAQLSRVWRSVQGLGEGNGGQRAVSLREPLGFQPRWKSFRN